MKVRVYVAFKAQIPYIIDMSDTKEVGEIPWNQRIRKALAQIDPSNLETDPNFYECLSSNGYELIAQTKNFQTETLDSTT